MSIYFTNKQDLKKRLSTLYDDLTVTNTNAKMILKIMNQSISDKKQLIDDIYFNENSPLKIINTEYHPRGEGDMTAEMLKVSMKYDEYIESLDKEIEDIIKKHDEAVKILFAMLSLPLPYSRILYLRYFKKMSCQEAMDDVDLERPTFFRKYSEALDKLMIRLQEYHRMHGD